MSIIVIFYLGLHFQGHLLQELDVQSYAWKLDENRLNGVRDTQRFRFSRWHIFNLENGD